MAILINDSEYPLLTIEEVKAHLRLNHSFEDSYLLQLIKTATAIIENYLGQSLLIKTWGLYVPLENYGPQKIELERPPIQEIISLEAHFKNGQKEDIKKFRLNGESAIPYLEIPGGDYAVKIVYRGGYGERPQNVPDVLRYAVLLLVGEFFESRSKESSGLSPTLIKLINPYKIRRLK